MGGVVVGPRYLTSQEAAVDRKWYRVFVSKVFHMLVWIFCVRGIKDTQCGFKLFSRGAAHLIFTNMHVERWAFDVELLYIGQKCGVPIVEVPATWTEIEGSKIKFTSTMMMF